MEFIQMGVEIHVRLCLFFTRNNSYGVCACACVRARACVRVCVCACVCACVCVCVRGVGNWEGDETIGKDSKQLSQLQRDRLAAKETRDQSSRFAT